MRVGFIGYFVWIDLVIFIKIMWEFYIILWD